MDKELQTIITNLQNKENITLHIDEVEDKTLFLMKLQEINNDLYRKHGLTDEVLDLQVYINKKRNEYNIVDENEILFVEPEGRFVQ